MCWQHSLWPQSATGTGENAIAPWVTHQQVALQGSSKKEHCSGLTKDTSGFNCNWLKVCTFHDGCKQGINQQIFNRKSISRKITHPQSLSKRILKICWSLPCLHPVWKVHAWIEICASLNHCKKTKADGSRLIPRKHTETLVLLSVVESSNCQGGHCNFCRSLHFVKEVIAFCSLGIHCCNAYCSGTDYMIMALVFELRCPQVSRPIWGSVLCTMGSKLIHQTSFYPLSSLHIPREKTK